MTKTKNKVKVLVMSVGEYKTNWTAQWLKKIGGSEFAVVCLPKQFEANAESYKNHNIKTYIYDESKYINGDMEYFGFRARNCGGVGRQGIAEALETLDDGETVFLELDDDTANLCVKKMTEDGKLVTTSIRHWENLKQLVLAEEEFYQLTGIECMGTTGATIPTPGAFIANHKIFNNFIMRKGVRLNFNGFKALCSDDVRFNIYHNIIDCTPMISTVYSSISFHQNQGDRNDGNAVIYNGDYSWKKSYSLKMIMPQVVSQKILRETNRVLFRENIQPSKLYPPICLADEDGNITGVAQW